MGRASFDFYFTREIILGFVNMCLDLFYNVYFLLFFVDQRAGAEAEGTGTPAISCGTKGIYL